MRRATALLLLFAACLIAKAPVRESRAPPPPSDPCAADLSGTYFYASDPTWEYQARDDGGTLELWVYRRFDGGVADAGATASMRLRRDGGTLEGEVRALGALPSGRLCDVTFEVQVQRCTHEGLVLRSASNMAIAEGCQTPARPRNPVMIQHALTRADAGGVWGDAGGMSPPP